jgi:hypothetical protein
MNKKLKAILFTIGILLGCIGYVFILINYPKAFIGIFGAIFIFLLYQAILSIIE